MNSCHENEATVTDYENCNLAASNWKKHQLHYQY